MKSEEKSLSRSSSCTRMRDLPLLDPLDPASSCSSSRRRIVRKSSLSCAASKMNYMDDSSVRSGSSGTSSLCSTFTADSGKHAKKDIGDVGVNGRQLLPKCHSDDAEVGLLSPGQDRAAMFYPHHHHQERNASRRSSTGMHKEYSSTEGKRVKRRVRFNDGLTLWHPCPYTQEDLICIWLQKEDYSDFHESMVLAVSAITTVPEAEVDNSCGNVLGRMYEACLEVDNGSCHSPGGTLTPSLSMNGESKRRLKALFKTTPDLVGLERAVSPFISQDRIDRRNALIEKIEDLQSCGWPDHETEARKLAEASIPMTRPARMFARQIAMGITPPSSKSSSYASLFTVTSLSKKNISAKKSSRTKNRKSSSGNSVSSKSVSSKSASSRKKLSRSKSAREVVEHSAVLPSSTCTSTRLEAEPTSDNFAINVLEAAKNAVPSSEPSKPSKSKRKLTRSKSARHFAPSRSSSSLKSRVGNHEASLQNRSLPTLDSSGVEASATFTPTRTSFLRSTSFKGLSRSVII